MSRRVAPVWPGLAGGLGVGPLLGGLDLGTSFPDPWPWGGFPWGVPRWRRRGPRVRDGVVVTEEEHLAAARETPGGRVAAGRAGGSGGEGRRLVRMARTAKRMGVCVPGVCTSQRQKDGRAAVVLRSGCEERHASDPAA